MAINPQTPTKAFRYYLYDNTTKIVYHTEEFPEDQHDLVYIGQSDNPKPASAAAAFMQEGKITEGFRIREYHHPL